MNSDPLERLLMPPDVKRRWLTGEIKSALAKRRKPIRNRRRPNAKRDSFIWRLRYQLKQPVSEIAHYYRLAPVTIRCILAKVNHDRRYRPSDTAGDVLAAAGEQAGDGA